MNLLDLLYTLRESGIHIQLVNDQLKIRGAEEKLIPGLIDQIKNKKAEIIDFLQRNVQKRLAHAAIEPAEKKEYYPLAPAQKRLYILQQMDADNLSYNMPDRYVLSVAEDIDPDITKLEETFKRLIARHDSLRTSFEIIDEEPVQRIHEDFYFEIEYFLATEDTEDTETHHSFIRPFDLSRAPLLRVGLIKERQTRYILMIDMHHIITDGISENLLVKEFMSLYTGEELSHLKIQYKDYSEWQQSQVRKEEFKNQEKYWLQEFEGEIPLLNIPIDYPRPAIQSFEGSEVNVELNREETKALNEIARTEGTTLFMVLLAVFNIFLSKLSSQEDIIVGTPTAGRKHPDLQQVMGMFINTLALRDYPSGKKTFAGFLGEVGERTLAAFENQDYPFEDLVEHTAVARDMSRNPLFDVMFVLQNMADAPVNIGEQEMQGLKLKPAVYDITTSKFDLTLEVNEVGEELHCSFNYCTQLFKKETILEFTQYFKKIISSVVENPGNKLSGIEIITGEEKNRILYQFNDTEAPYPNNQLLHELFEDQVEKTPENIAVIGPAAVPTSGTKHLESLTGTNASPSPFIHITYNQLNEQSNRLAQWLRGKGVEADTIVGIMGERSLEMIVGIIGILKAGGAYLPIDADSPEERINYMLNDSNANILLTAREIANSFGIWDLGFGISPRQGGQLAYLIYTSGSTGKPKGVMVAHRGVVNYIKWADAFYLKGEECDFPLYSSLAFDLTVTSIYVPLVSGNAIVLYNSDDSELPVSRIIREGLVRALKLTPTHLGMLKYGSSEYSGIRHLIVGGEDLTTELARETSRFFNKDNVEIYNEYGPTEATVGCMIYKYNPVTDCRKSVPIGIPIANTKIYILAENGSPVPTCVLGELCISGEGLARGYLNRPELTSEKFVPNPWITGELMYRTGDRARRLPDGNIEFQGRIDQQVKIRGFRIECGEIEYRLSGHHGVKDAVVIDRKVMGTGHILTDAESCLCAYIVPQSPGILDLSQIRDWLSDRLPGYMIPSYFVPIEHIPLTPNGKIDKKALPEPRLNAGSEYEAPRDKIEEKLIETWSEILGVNRDLIGIKTNFFDLGGNSLKAMLMTLKIHRVFNVILTLTRVFKTPEIRALAQYIKSAMGNRFTSVDPTEKKEYYAVSPAQKRLYLQQQRDLKSTTYNMPTVFVSEEEPDKKRLEQSFSDLIRRHESPRTSFVTIKGELVQKIRKTVDFLTEYYEGTSPDVENIIKNFVRAFDLSQSPLLRLGIINAENKKRILMVDMHHIITDAVSETILTQDFIMLYAKKQLPPLKLQYKDFSEWQTRFLSSGQLKKQEEYWLNQLKGNIPTANLPIDYNYPHPAPETPEEGRNVSFIVEKPLTGKLYDTIKETGTTLYMLLLGVYNVLLFKYTRQEDIIVGSPITGRRHADLQDIIGMFVNMMAMRNKPQKRKTFSQFLEEVKKNVVDAFDNQDYQFDELVNQLGIEEGASGNPMFNTVLAMQNVETGAKNIAPPEDNNRLKLHPYEFESRISRFDLTLFAEEISAEIHLQYRYSTALFREETIKKIGKHYMEILEQVTKNPGIRLEEITLSSDLLAGNHTIEDQEVDFNF